MNTFSPTQPEEEQAALHALVGHLSAGLVSRDIKIATVESCTGGGVAALLTNLAGSSTWFDRGFVTYSNASKVEMVGVDAATLAQYGAVSEQVAAEMAQGGVNHSDAQCALSITGIAGPGGGNEDKPVGMVCFAWAGFREQPITRIKYFQGDRPAVRAQSVYFSVQGVVELLT